jgi:transketolase
VSLTVTEASIADLPGSIGTRTDLGNSRGWTPVLSKPGLAPELLLRAKQRLLRMHYESGVGHVGGNLSSLDILMTLYHEILDPEDTFVLSKGHSAGALYVTLWSTGALSEDDLKSFHKDGTRLSGHPPVRGIPEIPFATGSLGHGLGLASGLALARKLKQERGRVFCLMSDGEWNEGSNWEALIFLKHQKLNNLTLIVDLNGLQGFGRTCDVADIAPLASKFRSFGLSTVEIDGHDCAALADVLRRHETDPVAIVARTKKGHGISFMEDRLEWHYLPLREEQYREAVLELTTQCARYSAGPS